MADRQKLERVLDLLINEEQDQDQATELLHQYMVEKAREVYESLMDEDEDFVDEIEDDMEEIEDDEVGDFEDDVEVDDEVDIEDEGEETEERLEDLEAALADLRAEFDRLMSDEEDDVELELDDEEVEVDSEEEEFDLDDDEFDLEMELEEATKLQDPVADPGMGTEGKYTGTGKGSKNGSVNKESPYTNVPPRTTDGEPTDFVGDDETGEKADSAKDHTPTSNVDVKKAEVKHGHDAQKGEGKYTGTGKGSKNGSVNTKSALGSGKSPRGK